MANTNANPILSSKLIITSYYVSCQAILLRKLEGFRILFHGRREREIDKGRRNGGYMQSDSHPIFVCHEDLEGQEMLLDAKMIVANCWLPLGTLRASRLYSTESGRTSLCDSDVILGGGVIPALLF